MSTQTYPPNRPLAAARVAEADGVSLAVREDHSRLDVVHQAPSRLRSPGVPIPGGVVVE